MPTAKNYLLFFIACLLAFLVAENPFFSKYSPQIIAFFSIIISYLSITKKKIPSYFIVFIIELIVFSTGGLSSPLLFLEYFLLFSLSFIESPKNITIYSIVLFLFLSSFLISFSSLILLSSLLFISPLAYLVTSTRQHQNHQQENLLLWLTLNLKKNLLKLHPQGQDRQIITNLINQSEDLITEIDQND